jgi:hypothetical protein
VAKGGVRRVVAAMRTNVRAIRTAAAIVPATLPETLETPPVLRR